MPCWTPLTSTPKAAIVCAKNTIGLTGCTIMCREGFFGDAGGLHAGHCQLVETETRLRRPGRLLPFYLSLRQPTSSPLSRPNSRIVFSALGGHGRRTPDAVAVERVERWGPRPTENAAHAPLMSTPACDIPVGASVEAHAHSGCSESDSAGVPRRAVSRASPRRSSCACPS